MDDQDNLDVQDNLDNINNDDGNSHHNLVGGGSTLLKRLVCLVDQVLQLLTIEL